jgi:serine/threonine-protein kinase
MLSHLADGRYELDAMLGTGGMASVWRGRDTRLDRPVAVKLLNGSSAADPTELQRLAQEARTVARLVHPNIVAVYDMAIEAGVPYVVMELVEGDDLRRRLAGGPLAMLIPDAVQVTDALEAAHRAGVVHRDIKPDNILLLHQPGEGLRLRHRHLQRRAGCTGRQFTGAPAIHARTGGRRPSRWPDRSHALGCVLFDAHGNPAFSVPTRCQWPGNRHQPAPR